MEALTIDSTYGKALFDAARDLGKEDLILQELDEIVEVMRAEEGLCKLMEIPTISAAARKEALGKIFEGRICDELLNFLFVLTDKRRTFHFQRIVRRYRDFYNEAHGYYEGEVYTSFELDERRIAKLEEETGALLKENIKLKNIVDPAVVGGFKIMVKGKIIDASLQNKLKKLAALMEA